MAAKLFDEILKFNPYHDARGRFSSANGATSFTYSPGKSKAHDLAIARGKENQGTSKGFKGTLYHGSPATDIEEFDMSRAGANTSSGEKLLFFTDSKQMAEDFSYERIDTDSKFVQQRGKKGRVYEVDVEMKNPLDFRNLSDKDIENIIKLDAEGLLTKELVQSMSSNHQLLKTSLNLTAESLKNLGYDGLIANTGKAGHGSLEYAVIDSKQTKIRKSNPMRYDNIIEKDTQKSFSIFKADNDKRLVFGWASVSIDVNGEQLQDRQNDMIDPEVLEEAAYEYVLKFRDTGEEHIPTMRKKGKLVESCVFTAEKQKAMGLPEGILPIGWWIGFKIEDDAAWEKVKNGTYKMFSIEGKANRVPVEKARRDYDEYPEYDMWLEENLDATIEEQKAAKEHYKKSKPVAKTFDEIIEKFNPYHDSRGRFASANSATSMTYAPGKSPAHDKAIERERDRQARVSRNYGETNLKDSLEEINSGKTNSLAKYIGPDGKLTPEREAVHKEIIDGLLKGKIPVEGQATMTMLGGGPASGKSSVMSTNTSQDKHAVTVDPDAIKNMLPGYAEMAKKSSNAAAYYHEESSALAKRFSEVAFNENYNVIYDGTGNGKVSSVMKKVDAAKAKGYRVEAKYVSVDTETAVQRNAKRYEDARAKGENPRLVPDDVVRKTHANCTDISVKVADKFDRIEIWDNNGARGSQKLIATGGGGKHLVATDTEKFNSYLSKGMKGLEGFTTLPDGQVVPVE